MTDQGWMVDDGTCDACLYEHCHACTDPSYEGDLDGRLWAVCCCEVGYVSLAPPEVTG